jgi:hypothetical protein
MREISALDTSWPPINSVDVRNEFGTVLYAMTNLASRFPLLGKWPPSMSPTIMLTIRTAVSAAKLQKQLAEL